MLTISSICLYVSHSLILCVCASLLQLAGSGRQFIFIELNENTHNQYWLHSSSSMCVRLCVIPNECCKNTACNPEWDTGGESERHLIGLCCGYQCWTENYTLQKCVHVWAQERPRTRSWVLQCAFVSSFAIVDSIRSLRVYAVRICECVLCCVFCNFLWPFC